MRYLFATPAIAAVGLQWRPRPIDTLHRVKAQARCELRDDSAAVAAAREGGRGARAIIDARLAGVDRAVEVLLDLRVLAAAGGAGIDVVRAVEAVLVAGADGVAVERSVDGLTGTKHEDGRGDGDDSGDEFHAVLHSKNGASPRSEGKAALPQARSINVTALRIEMTTSINAPAKMEFATPPQSVAHRTASSWWPLIDSLQSGRGPEIDALEVPREPIDGKKTTVVFKAPTPRGESRRPDLEE